MAADLTFQAAIQGLRTALEADLQTAAGERPQPLPWQPGDRVSATVETLRTPDRGLLRVGPLLFDAALPPGTTEGQRLDLQFLGASPRVTFALLDAASGGERTLGAHSSLASTAPEVQISPAARDLAALIRGVGQRISTARPAIVDAVPLLQSAAPDAAALASALKRSVEQSGMFYESHLAQWLAGDRAIKQLRGEPQAALAPPAASRAGEEGQTQVPRAEEQRLSSPGCALLGSASAAARDEPHGPLLGPLGDAVNPQALSLLRTQLDGLEARQLWWQGFAWPGVPMEWRVDDQERGHSADAGDDPVQWTSHLKVVLPRLGEISANLQLAGGKLQLRLTAADADSRRALAAARPALNAALARAAIPLIGFEVADEPA